MKNETLYLVVTTGDPLEPEKVKQHIEQQDKEGANAFKVWDEEKLSGPES